MSVTSLITLPPSNPDNPDETGFAPVSGDHPASPFPLGAWYTHGKGCSFKVWAPMAQKAELVLYSPSGSVDTVLPLEREDQGNWSVEVGSALPGRLYRFRLDQGEPRPDPASRSQPQGVHGPSAVVDMEAFRWSDAGWKGLRRQDLVFYELHVGAFSPEGTFAGALAKLDHLKDLGITAVEIMPVAQFPGERNWGYDGVYPFAVQSSYGGADGLKALVDACHQRGLAVFLDVVYNHMGPEGNYLQDFGPYFTDRYRTPWGKAMNYDDAHCQGMRALLLENALEWFRHYHLDGLRLDAVHAVFDLGARPILRELSRRVDAFARETGRLLHLVGECDLNDPRYIRPEAEGGLGLHAQWCDEYHHALHALLTGEKAGYYSDFGKVGQMAKALAEPYVYSGEYSPHRRKPFGETSTGIPSSRFVVFAQNHDQVGNRLTGDRLSALVPPSAQRLAAAMVLLSPYLPFLFMGEEFGETAPFLYFADHGDRRLVETVRRCRKEEFSSFNWQGEPPDPFSEETFRHCKLDWSRPQGEGRTLFHLYHFLLSLRKSHPAFAGEERAQGIVFDEEKRLLRWFRGRGRNRLLFLANFDAAPHCVDPLLPQGAWERVFDTEEKRFGGPGPVLLSPLESGEESSLDALSLGVYRILHGEEAGLEWEEEEEPEEPLSEEVVADFTAMPELRGAGERAEGPELPLRDTLPGKEG